MTSSKKKRRVPYMGCVRPVSSPLWRAERAQEWRKLQPAGHGLAPSVEQLRHEHYRKALANLPEDQRGQNPVTVAAERWYWPDHDILDTLPAGRAVLACAAGQPMPIAEARRRGLVPSAEEHSPASARA